MAGRDLTIRPLRPGKGGDGNGRAAPTGLAAPSGDWTLVAQLLGPLGADPDTLRRFPLEQGSDEEPWDVLLSLLAIDELTALQKLAERTGLRFVANLGILDHEKTSPQPIMVDAELNLGPQPLMPRDDDIGHVLDYRKVRKIIIDECTAEHVNLLESLIGKLAHRLMQLPGVLGVRVKIVKLEIFDDCEVAIRVETGLW